MVGIELFHLILQVLQLFYRSLDAFNGLLDRLGTLCFAHPCLGHVGERLRQRCNAHIEQEAQTNDLLHQVLLFANDGLCSGHELLTDDRVDLYIFVGKLRGGRLLRIFGDGLDMSGRL